MDRPRRGRGSQGDDLGAPPGRESARGIQHGGKAWSTEKTSKELTGEGGALQQLTKKILEPALDGEIMIYLGYETHDPVGRGSGSSHKGSRSKTALTDVGTAEISVPRTRADAFKRRSSANPAPADRRKPNGAAPCRGGAHAQSDIRAPHRGLRVPGYPSRPSPRSRTRRTLTAARLLKIEPARELDIRGHSPPNPHRPTNVT
ncbi:transposase [Streptomyces albospinus]|uniref:transposase n=1 Tax=Streptomyces albospinus TaxID=285515 RepID=UPI003570A7F1